MHVLLVQIQGNALISQQICVPVERLFYDYDLVILNF